MSIDQVIAELGKHTRADLQKVELAIRTLRDAHSSPDATQLRRRKLDFDPIQIQGEPLSATIIRDRGER